MELEAAFCKPKRPWKLLILYKPPEVAEEYTFKTKREAMIKKRECKMQDMLGVAFEHLASSFYDQQLASQSASKSMWDQSQNDISSKPQPWKPQVL